MNKLVRNYFGKRPFYKKKVISEEYVVKQEDSMEQIEHMKFEEFEKRCQEFDSKTYEKGLKEGEVPIPISPTLKPIRVDAKALRVGKKYYWCRCGMSQQQPFCDGSHQGTAFYPKSFVL